MGILTILVNGNFQQPVTISLPNRSDQLELGDFDGNGALDVVTLESNFGNAVSSPIRILLRNDDGDLTVQDTVLVAPPGTVSLAVADVDEDGHLDVIAGSSWTAPAGIRVSGSVSVFRGIGDGTFEPLESYGNYGWGFSDLMTADVDADGHLDIVASTAEVNEFPTGPSRGLAVLLNNGDGTFAAPIFYDHSGSTISDIAIADFNGDDLIDIVTGNLDDNTFSILYSRAVSSPPVAASVPQPLSIVGDENVILRTFALAKSKATLGLEQSTVWLP